MTSQTRAFNQGRRQVVFDRAKGKCEACGSPLGEQVAIQLFLGECSTIAQSWALCVPCHTSSSATDPAWLDKFVAHCIAAAHADPDGASAYARAIDRCSALLAQIQHLEASPRA